MITMVYLDGEWNFVLKKKNCGILTPKDLFDF